VVVDIGGIVDHYCLNLKVRDGCCFVDIGGIVDHQCLNLKVRDSCLFC
jgi:hypothetical protein